MYKFLDYSDCINCFIYNFSFMHQNILYKYIEMVLHNDIILFMLYCSYHIFYIGLIIYIFISKIEYFEIIIYIIILYILSIYNKCFNSNILFYIKNYNLIDIFKFICIII